MRRLNDFARRNAWRIPATSSTVGATDTQDAMLGLDGRMLAETGDKVPDPAKPEEAPPPARMFYAAYFKKAPGRIRESSQN